MNRESVLNVAVAGWWVPGSEAAMWLVEGIAAWVIVCVALSGWLLAIPCLIYIITSDRDPTHDPERCVSCRWDR